MLVHDQKDRGDQQKRRCGDGVYVLKEVVFVDKADLGVGEEDEGTEQSIHATQILHTLGADEQREDEHPTRHGTPRTWEQEIQIIMKGKGTAVIFGEIDAAAGQLKEQNEADQNDDDGAACSGATASPNAEQNDEGKAGGDDGKVNDAPSAVERLIDGIVAVDPIVKCEWHGESPYKK